MKLEQAPPAPALREHVRRFQQRRADIRNVAVVYPIAARPDQILEFYLQDMYVVRNGEVGAQEIVPRAVVVVPRTRLSAELILRGCFEVFTVHFHASGFLRAVPRSDG